MNSKILSLITGLEQEQGEQEDIIALVAPPEPVPSQLPCSSSSLMKIASPVTPPPTPSLTLTPSPSQRKQCKVKFHSPLHQHSPSPLHRHSPSPLRRHSPSPLHKKVKKNGKKKKHSGTLKVLKPVKCSHFIHSLCVIS